MIIKGRSPTMRHVSRTHRVAQHWLFDRINLDPKIQIEYVDTKKQLADMLTEGNLTRDEWNHLLRLFNISHFSLIYCSQNFSLTSCTEAMAKRIQEQKGEEKIVAKSKPTLNSASFVSANSSTVQSPIASKSQEILKAPCQNDWTSTGRLGAREFNQDAASSSQAWQKDAVLDESTRRLVASENADTKGKVNIWPHNLHIYLYIQTAYRTWRRFSRL